MVPGFQQVKFSAPDMEDIFVDLPNTNDDSMMIHVEVMSFERGSVSKCYSSLVLFHC